MMVEKESETEKRKSEGGVKEFVADSKKNVDTRANCPANT